MSAASSWPSLLTAVRMRVRDGCRLVVAARLVPATIGDPGDLPTLWAGKTVIDARIAFDGLAFTARGETRPPWSAEAPAGYEHRVSELQRGE